MPTAKTNDSTGRLWTEAGEQRTGVVAEVAPIAPIHRTYSFSVPAALEASLKVGQRVMVPLGRRGRLVRGFVVSLDHRTWDSTLRPVDSLVDAASHLTPELLDLGREISLHYACPLGRTLSAMTPEAVRQGRGLSTVRYARRLASDADVDDSGKRVTEKRRALLDALRGKEEPVPVDRLLAETGVSATILRSLVAKHWIEIITRKEVGDTETTQRTVTDPAFELTDAQVQAIDGINVEIDARRFSVTLLYGVGGSGKTEVYIRTMRRAVERGGQAILLVPEIVLTTQLVGRLASRFPDVAVNHSGLSDAQRAQVWRQITAGEKKVLVGTRSAVFAPCPNLRLICVDEEQETSYKNLQAPRFHVRDVAIMRAKQLGIPVVLGSATPSVETWYNSKHRSAYRRAILPRRVNERPLPKVHIVDMRDEFAEQKRTVVLSRPMERLLGETLGRGEQAILLINRRGFADRLYCPSCKARVTCPNCNVGLVVHRTVGRSICHYCHTRIPTPDVCPNLSCGEKLVHMGLGTQQVEEVMAERFPKARVARVDSDTMKHRRQYERLISDFEGRRIDVLVGTQMIAKGLDFPFVSFVGVVHADAGALAGDFRGQERLFQLMTQVAGRAGRAETTGRVVVQTTAPDLPAMRFALRHDYESFVAEELDARRRGGLPPFRRLTRVVLAHPREETTRIEAEGLAERIRGVIASLSLSHADVLGATPCVLSRLRGRYRYDLLIRTANATSMRELLSELNSRHALRCKTASTVVDVDPVALS